MATITPVATPNVSPVNGATGMQWTNMTGATSDVGLPVEGPLHSDRSVQVNSGSWGGTTIVFEGSNDGVTYETLRDPQGNVLAFTANGLKQVLETTRFVRPRASVAGTGTGINVTLCGGKSVW